MTFDYVSCLLCDIQHGMTPVGGILLSSEHWFALHAPPAACARHVVILAPRRHLSEARRVGNSQLFELAEHEREMRQALLSLAPRCTVRVEVVPQRFGHVAWLLSAQQKSADELIAETLAVASVDQVRAWADEVEMALHEARITAAGGRLPPPPPLPGTGHRDTIHAVNSRSCDCGTLLRRKARFCHRCGRPAIEGET